MTGIKFVMAFTVTAFDLAIVARRIRTNEFVPNTEFSGCSLKQRSFIS